MLSSISPVGEAARGQRWRVTVGAYLLGTCLGGALVGLLAGALGATAMRVLGRLPASAALLAFGTAALIGVVIDVRGRVPSLHRQVDERWLDHYRGWVYGFGYGSQLGVGVVTLVPGSATWVMLLGAGLSGSPTTGAVVGLIFGATRGLPILLGRDARTVARLRLLLAAVDRLRRRADIATLVAQAAVGLTSLSVLAL